LSRLKKKDGIMAHICNPSYMGGIGRRITIQGCLGQKMKNPTETTKAQKG
jgi:hypothetical protein